MAQYLMSVLTGSPELASAAEQAAIEEFNQGLVDDGHWVFAGGLTVPEIATVVDGRGASALVTDGPYLESKEWIIGFWVVEAADLDVALKLAVAGSQACNRRVEVRAFL